MLDKDDVAVLRGMFVEVLEGNNHILKREMRDETYSVVNAAIFASEKRMMQYIDDIKTEIIDGIVDILDESILPQIADLRTDVDRIKFHLQLV